MAFYDENITKKTPLEQWKITSCNIVANVSKRFVMWFLVACSRKLIGYILEFFFSENL
jgi:hypothetical protein